LLEFEYSKLIQIAWWCAADAAAVVIVMLLLLLRHDASVAFEKTKTC